MNAVEMLVGVLLLAAIVGLIYLFAKVISHL